MLDDIYTLTLKGRLQGQTVENVLWYVVTADSDYTSLCLALYTKAVNELLPGITVFQSIDFEWTSVVAQKVWPIPAFFPNEVGVSQFGSFAVNAMPSEVALCMTKRTILAGPKYRGRIYIAGLPQTAMDHVTGLWDSTTTISADSVGVLMCQNVNTVVPGGVLVPIIWHRALHTYTALNNCKARNVPRSQRRRQIGRGI